MTIPRPFSATPATAAGLAHAFGAALRDPVEAGLVHRMASNDGTVLLLHQSGIEEYLDQVKALWDPRL